MSTPSITFKRIINQLSLVICNGIFAKSLQSIQISVTPNFAVERLTFLFHIREYLNSVLGTEIGYPDCGYWLYSSVPPNPEKVS
jgi:hypothetical protein